MLNGRTELRNCLAWANQADLRQILASRLLTELALNAVQEVDWSKVRRVRRGAAGYQPQMMLTLLCYCYAAGIYGSQQIEEVMRRDETVRYICARTYPDRAEIQQFRRDNRPMLEQCLASVLNQAWTWAGNIAGCALLGTRPTAIEQSKQAAKEAYQRLEVASFVDLMQIDD